MGLNSKLELLGDEAYRDTGVELVIIPDNVVELGDKCFCYCKCLRNVTLGPSSKLQQIGDLCLWIMASVISNSTVLGETRKCDF